MNARRYARKIYGIVAVNKRHCSVEFDPESENIRRESKISVPDRNIDPAVATTPGIGADSVAIRHPPTLKDGAAQLAKRGTIKFTYYYDSSQH